MAPTTVVTSKGALVLMGKELGKGGEGSVFDLPALPAQVAKLYHKAPDVKKQAKLTFMAAAGDANLLSYAAWPQETLHGLRGGPVVGFLMPKIAGRDPIHMVYSPAHRRQERPKAAWDYLLFVARNTAAAFEALHSHGHVLGDVNQGNVMVGSDSKVVLIDCDSCQVNANGVLHLCEVGVSHFTPPELQGLSSFDGVVRSPNHDNFGLALLIFHLLFGGRHPYSGVPLKDGVGDALETDIKGFRYAYAKDAQSRGFSPPPRSIPLAIVPSQVEAMFHAAFTEAGARSNGRPTAEQWVASLDALRGKLKQCGASAMHVFPDHVSGCPWCSLEKDGVAYFVDSGASFAPTSSGFVLAQIWGLIEAVAPPPALTLPDLTKFDVSPAPLPSEIPSQSTISAYRILAVILGLGTAVLAPQIWGLGLIGAVLGWWIAGTLGGKQRQQEKTKRMREKAFVLKEYDRVVEQVQREAGVAGFAARRQQLAAACEEYKGLAKAEADEIAKLHSTAQARQKHKFLDSLFIDSAHIPGVGPARKAALRSFGIETAADVERNKVRQVRGFGDGLTRAMTDWRGSCERRFTFNPLTAVTEADKNAVRGRFGARRTALEAQIRSGPADLQRFRQEAASRAKSLQPGLTGAAKRLAQASADLSVF